MKPHHITASLQRQRGSALVLAIGLLGLFSMLAVGYLSSARTNLEAADYGVREARARELATAGVYAAIGDLRKVVLNGRINDAPVLRLTLTEQNVFNAWAIIESISYDEVELRVDPNDESLRKAIVYKDTIGARARLEAEKDLPPGEVSVIRLTEVVPDEREEDMPIRRRLQRMGMDDKINLAQAGNKEERMALAMDPNKAVHHYLLKNAKITLDEIAFMARLPSLNPDVLDKIAENPAYTQNPSVAKALVYNPKTPVRTAIRLPDRLPRSEVMNLAERMGMTVKLHMAARTRLETSKG